MAFKTVKSYNDDKYKGLFRLVNDGDYADVIFMYQSVDDVLVANVHYIKSPDYSGYVHCCEKGCPACAKGIRTQTKLFIPVYNIEADEIQYFDRSMRFEPQLQNDVFSRFPNPSEYVFRITRHGEANSVDTSYEINAIGKNTYKPYAQILAEQHATMPEHYNTICLPLSISDLQSKLDAGEKPSNGYSPNEAYSYNATPRGGASAAAPGNAVSSNFIPPEQPTITPDTFTAPPEYIPGGEFESDPAEPVNTDSIGADPELPDPVF